MDNIRIAIYIRLSLADEDTGRKKDESNSIVNQRNLIHRFLDNHKELSLYPRTEFVDDGFTGTNTDRPAYQNMMEQLKAGKFQVLVTKDFSRAHRDYLEMGEMIEYLLPFLGVRYIAINDGYDSKDYVGTTGGLDVVMRAIVYDAYSKDMSLKESTAKKLGQKKGRRVAGYPAYGYIRDPKNIGMDILDPEAAQVVRRAFDMVLSGVRMTDIARVFNAEGIPTPSEYFRLKNPGTRKYEYTSDKHAWSVNTVRQILERYVYTGASVGGVRKQLGPCIKSTVSQKKDDWIIVPDMHEAIITVDEWEKVQGIIKSGAERAYVNELYPLKSLVFCGNCGRHMIKYKTSNRFNCRHGASVDGSPCQHVRSMKIPELNNLVYDAIRDYMGLLDSKKKESAIFRKEKSTAIRNKVLSSAQMQERIEKLKKDKLKYYEKFSSSNLSKEGYLREKKAIDDEIASLEEEISAARIHIMKMEEDSQEVTSELEAICKLYKDEEELTYEMAHAFVDKIIIHVGGEVEIVWRFKDIFTQQ